MPESVVFPFPKKPVRLEIYARNRKGKLEKKWTQNIDPQSYFIRKFIPRYETMEIAYSGNPSKRVDIVLIPEGYTSNEKREIYGSLSEFC